jgi:hypothetical protein
MPQCEQVTEERVNGVAVKFRQLVSATANDTGNADAANAQFSAALEAGKAAVEIGQIVPEHAQAALTELEQQHWGGGGLNGFTALGKFNLAGFSRAVLGVRPRKGVPPNRNWQSRADSPDVRITRPIHAGAKAIWTPSLARRSYRRII